ncbi:MAG: type II CRISPR RNA-guided endonuclease Cas9 [Erysipelotrichaceae bacterium]
MKITLGLDLGTASIGWAVIREENGHIYIDGLGSRIIDFEDSEQVKFGKGSSISKNADRTKKRTARKCYDRYIIRRTLLTEFFRKHNMLPNEHLIKLDALDLWALRAKAVDEKITLPELARVLYHINQKRGYKTVKGDTEEKNTKEYVAAIVSRNQILKKEGLIIGQYLYKNLKEDRRYRCKGQIFPREAYESEFDKIIETQKTFYPEILSSDNIKYLRDYVIFYQRDLKSCKHLVSICELEKRSYIKQDKNHNEFKDSNGNTIMVESGPRVAHSSNPLAQICRIWETINNIVFTDKYNKTLVPDLDRKMMIFDYLSKNNKITKNQLYQLAGINGNVYSISDEMVKNLKGNTTETALIKATKKNSVIIDMISDFHKNLFVEKVNIETGELIRVINPEFEQLALYRLWHTLYSINNKDILKDVLKKKYKSLDDDEIANLSNLAFSKQPYAKKSIRAINKLLPYLTKGYCLYDAKVMAGYHDTVLTKAENRSRTLLDSLPHLKHNELRQPLVEKVLNQMINLVNALMQQYNCHFDEIRVELARALKQSKTEREDSTFKQNKNNQANEKAKERIIEEGAYPSKSAIEKYRLWEECSKKCIYCNKDISLSELLNGEVFEREHIIPKSLLFNDSFANKVCSCSDCNRNKNNRTAYDYMASKSDAEFEDYINRVNRLGFSKTKRANLLTPESEISTSFIDRQLRQTQYISKKACQILQSVCYNVTTSTGSVTDYLRRIWGWKNILEDLNIDTYRLCDQTTFKEIEHKGSIIKREVINDWTKRKDHRHHAIDALVVACTSQSFIQRLNNLSSIDDVPFESINNQSKEQKDRYTKLDKYALTQPHFSYQEVREAVKSILVSFRSTRKTTTPGKRYIYKNGKKILVQSNILVPRGALCEESVYGRINHKGKDEIVIRYKIGVGIDSLFNTKDTVIQIEKKVNSIIDKTAKEVILEHLKQHNYKLKECFKEIIYLDNNKTIPIYSVRCLTGNDKVLPVRIESDGSIKGYVKSGRTHSISIYQQDNGDYYENECTFQHAVDRKKNNIPVIIKDPNLVWDSITNRTDLDESFLRQLPEPNSRFIVSLQRDDMFIFGLEKSDVEYALANHDYALISKYLYKVQNASKGNYRFCLHTITEFDLSKANKPDKRFLNIRNAKSLLMAGCFKIRIDILGNIVLDRPHD